MSGRKAQTCIGEPCKKCGQSLRYVLRGMCVACLRGSKAKLTPADGEKWLALLSALAPCKNCGSTERRPSGGCACASAREAAWHRENKEHVANRNRAYRQANAEQLKKRKAERMTPERKAAKSATDKRYREENAEAVLAKGVKWAQENRERTRIYKRNNKSKRRQAEGRLSPGIEQQLFELQRGKCACCKKPLGKNYHLDHRVALARGGTNTDDNMQLLRARCNIQKGAKDPIDFMQSRGFLL